MPKGYDKVVWQAEGFQDQTSAGVTLTYRSPDGEEGYPGNLNIKVIYSLNEDNELKIEYWAETDKATPVNLTHHGYWNLAGAGSGSILEHELQLNCSNYLPVDAGLVPSGEIKSVKDTPMDFTSPKAIGRDMDHVPGGYDHCFLAAPSEPSSPGLRLVARVYEPKSGRAMEVWTTKPGLQFYAGNFLDGVHGAGGGGF
ncbi:Aldose 1-epimerase [subsurface metagenome]